MTRSREFALALLLELVGAAAVLLVSVRHWQTVTTPRVGRPDDVLQLTGRTVDAASTALALVALAGVVAVLATRGLPRRVVGVLVAGAGAALVWRAIAAMTAVGADRARSLVSQQHRTVSTTAVTPHVDTHPVWPWLSLCCGVLVLAAGMLVAWRGARWQIMSARYEAAPAPTADPAKTAATMWTALDRGDDPT